MSVLDRIQERLPEPGPTIVLPEGHDERIIEAGLRIGAMGFARPLVFAGPGTIARCAHRLHFDPAGVTPVEPREAATTELVDDFAAHRGLPTSEAARLLARPVVLAAAMVRHGVADTVLAGATTTTRDVLHAYSGALDLADPWTRPSGFFLVETADHRSFLFADCAVNRDPDAGALAEIALETAQSARRIFGWEPRVAMLSFSTHGSAEHPLVDKVRRATAIAREREPALLIDGELQADAAVDLTVAHHKLDPIGPVAGQANVLVFPDLNAGNIAYKLVRALGHARAVGVILQGFSSPVSDLSRGATVAEIVATATVLGALVDKPIGVS